MTASLSRIGAIVRADFLIRFRRVSTAVVFLLVSAFAYVWIPAPSTGRALIQINGHRAINNAGAIGLGTASLAMIFVGLFGYYVISNTIRRDVTSRCGLVAASTPMRSTEYLLGKFIGNLAFLATFITGFMITSMIMLLVRAEAPFEPLVFIGQYLLLTPSAIVFVAAVAVLFESIPWLAGKLGDVVYFFFWCTVIGLVVGHEVSNGGMNWARCLDFTGFGFMIEQMQHKLGTHEVSIGSSSFNQALPPIVFPGLTLTSDWVVPRVVSTLMPVALLPVARLFFHRFDPVRTKQRSEKSHRNWIGRIQNLFKPLSRRAVSLMLGAAPAGSFFGAIWIDAALTFTLFPLAFVALIAAIVFGLVAPTASSLPILFAALGVIVSDIATRESRAGTTASTRAIAPLRERYVWWKLGSTCLLSFLFCAGAIARSMPRGPLLLCALVVAIFFVAATATALGVVTSNPKTFIVAFLTFWYVVVNDRGANSMLDFAGFYGRASAATILLYAAISIGAVVLAEIFYRSRLERA